MYIDHERARFAYERVEAFATVSVDFPEGIPEPDLSEFSKRVAIRDNRLWAIGKIDKIKEHLKAKSDNGAWKIVLDDLLKAISEKDMDKYKSWATKFPTMVQTCGLLQTVAFYEEKAKKVYDELEKWLTEGAAIPWPNPEIQKLRDRIFGLGDQNMDIYRLATREAVAYMSWVKKAVSVLIPD